MRQTIHLAAVAAALGAAVIWFFSARSARQADAALASLTNQRAALAADVRRIADRLAAAEARRAAMARDLAALGPLKTSSPAAPSPPANAPRHIPTMSELIANNPKLELLELARYQAAALLDYGHFYHAAGLTSEQIKNFEDIWVKREERWMDLEAAARAQDETGRQAVAALQAQATAEYEAAKAEVLGADASQQMKDYERTNALRNVVVNALAGAAALEGTPLDAEQGEKLLAAAASASSRDAKRDRQDPATVDWDALDAQAQQILSPEQFALFQHVAPPSGFSSRWKFQLDAAIRRAQQADTNNAAAAATKPPGG